MMKAGGMLHKRQAEIRIQFHHAPGNLHEEAARRNLADMNSNELGWSVSSRTRASLPS